jgi:hypothetical protein
MTDVSAASAVEVGQTGSDSLSSPVGAGPLPDAPHQSVKHSERSPTQSTDGISGPWLEALGVALGIAFVYALLRTSPHLAAGAFNDDGVYLSLGKALAQGDGYRSIYTVGEPLHVKYPVGVPAVFAALWWLLSSLTQVHAAALWLSLALSAATAGLLWFLARSQLGLSPSVAIVPVLVPFLLEGSVQYFNLAVSEPYFLFTWALALFAFGQWRGLRIVRDLGEGGRRRARGTRMHVFWVVVLGVAVGAAAIFRTQAVVLIPAFGLALLASRRRRVDLVVFGFVALAPIAVWTVWHRLEALAGPLSTQPDEMAYVQWVPEGGPAAIGARIIEILASQWAKYGTALPAHVASSRVLGLTVIGLFLVAVLDGARRLRRDRPDLVWSFGLGALVIALWPYAQDRFVLALLPFAGLLAAQALAGWKAAATPRGRIWLTVAVGAVLVLVASRQFELRRTAYAERHPETLYFHPAQFLPDNTAFLAAASGWLAENGRADDRPLTPLSAGLFLYSGLAGVNATPAEPSVGPSVFDEPGRFLARRVLEDGVNLLFLWNPNFPITRDAAIVQQSCAKALRFLGMTEEHTSVAVFRIDDEDACFRERFLEPARAIPLAASRETH